MQTLFNQLDAAHVSWKGYAQDLGNPDASPRNSSAGAARRTTPAPTSAARPTPPRAPRAAPLSPTREARTPPTSTCPSTSRSRGSSRSCSRATALRSTSRTCSTRPTASTTTCRARRRRPAFSWISPNNCSDAHDAVCHGNNLSGGFSDPNTPNPPKNYTGGLYAADLFLEHVVPEIEASPAFKDGGLIDITFDEAFPPFTYTGNSFYNSTIVPARRARPRSSRDSAGETLDGHGRLLGADRAEHAARHGRERQPALPGPRRQRLHRPADQLRGPDGARPSPTAPASSAAAATRPVARTDTARARRRASTITDDSIVATDTGRSVTGTGIPPGAFVGQVTDTPDTPDSREPVGRRPPTPARSRSSTPPASAVDTTGPVSGITLGAAHSADRPALRRHRPDHRRRRHGQRAHQPLHHAGHGEQRLLQPLQLAAHDGGPLRRRGGLAGPRRRRATSATRPSPGSPPSAPTCSTTRPVTEGRSEPASDRRPDRRGPGLLARLPRSPARAPSRPSPWRRPPRSASISHGRRGHPRQPIGTGSSRAGCRRRRSRSAGW